MSKRSWPSGKRTSPSQKDLRRFPKHLGKRPFWIKIKAYSTCSNFWPSIRGEWIGFGSMKQLWSWEQWSVRWFESHFSLLNSAQQLSFWSIELSSIKMASPLMLRPRHKRIKTKICQNFLFLRVSKIGVTRFWRSSQSIPRSWLFAGLLDFLMSKLSFD